MNKIIRPKLFNGVTLAGLCMLHQYRFPCSTEQICKGQFNATWYMYWVKYGTCDY